MLFYQNEVLDGSILSYNLGIAFFDLHFSQKKFVYSSLKLTLMMLL